ncbi:hypothetical protein [Coleofasciculus sp. F4-SAH-05]|uniref:hypothetical protein n=1 Tax=Coleofasciculus sp. F4-SAH-05 TaxID=3069525 RepID=UPI0032F8DFB4
MSIIYGIPDWQGVIRTEKFTILPASDDPNQHFALPVNVKMGNDKKDKPDFFLSFICPPGSADPETSIYTMINMGLETDQHIEEAFEYLRQEKPQATLVAANFAAEAFWNLEIPQMEPIVQQFAWENVNTARIYQRIPEAAGLLIYNGLKETSLIARAAVQCQLIALVPRLPLKVKFNTRELLQAVWDLHPSQSSIPRNDIYNYFLRDPNDLPLTIEEGDYDVTKRDLFSQTMVGHLRMKLGSFAASPSIAEGPHIGLQDPSDPSLPTETLWNLDIPLVVATPLMFDFDPFDQVLEIISEEGIDYFTYFSNTPELPNELTTENVYVDSNLPPNLQNVYAVDVNLRVEPEYSYNGNAQTKLHKLFPYPEPDADPPIVSLRFKHPNQKIYNSQVLIITMQYMHQGEKIDRTGDYLYIGADQIPVFVTVSATSQLLNQAEIDATIADPNQSISDRGTLNADNPAATFVYFAELSQEASLEIIARSVEDNTKTLHLDLPPLSTQLDLFSFPEFGTKSIEVTVNFQSGTDLAIVEFLPEGTDEPRTEMFTPTDNQKTVSYSPGSLFDYRYRYRLMPTDSSPIPDWSDYLLPSEPLTLEV